MPNDSKHTIYGAVTVDGEPLSASVKMLGAVLLMTGQQTIDVSSEFIDAVQGVVFSEGIDENGFPVIQVTVSPKDPCLECGGCDAPTPCSDCTGCTKEEPPAGNNSEEYITENDVPTRICFRDKDDAELHSLYLRMPPEEQALLDKASNNFAAHVGMYCPSCKTIISFTGAAFKCKCGLCVNHFEVPITQ